MERNIYLIQNLLPLATYQGSPFDLEYLRKGMVQEIGRYQPLLVKWLEKGLF